MVTRERHASRGCMEVPAEARLLARAGNETKIAIVSPGEEIDARPTVAHGEGTTAVEAGLTEGGAGRTKAVVAAAVEGGGAELETIAETSVVAEVFVGEVAAAGVAQADGRLAVAVLVVEGAATAIETPGSCVVRATTYVVAGSIAKVLS
eukprot:TRINITY_DN41526_c0_g2_i1.p2 TRINITY_DN41526_c0_g2~~TRINITY_DN41526_c0_g2_i1.p2  ORF type:complete len:164 (+),score=21.73 TRINITY_DN41526_c0_g2_i1:43-492(+)